MMTPKPIKVLQVIDTLGMGGAETWLMEVLRLWSATPDKRVQMDFMVTSGNTGLFDEEARELGARLFYVPFRKKHLPSFAKDFRRILQAGNYDAIHDHADYVSGWHFLIGAGLLPPVRVTHVHNPAYQILNNYGVRWSRRLTSYLGTKLVSHFATVIAGTSRQVLTEYGFDGPLFSRHPKGALHCGFRPERFLGDTVAAKARLCEEFQWPADSKIILFAGRIDRSPDPADSQVHKNSLLAIQIGIQCATKDSRVCMLLAGALSPAVPVLQGQIATAGCTGRIIFGGVRRDIEQLMLASDVLLFPSRGEGLGMVAVEAQAAGLPVVASTAVPRECVVMPELVTFVPLTKSAKEWAEAVIVKLRGGRADNILSNRRVAESPFAINTSAFQLLKMYNLA